MNRVIARDRGLAGALLLICFCAPLRAQGTLADYERAATITNARTLVSRADLSPHWIAGSERFWYLSRHFKIKTFVMVDPVRNTQSDAFDHARLAASLSQAAGVTFTADALPFDQFEFVERGAAIGFEFDEQSWRCELKGYSCSRTPSLPGARKGEVLSPDGLRAVFVRDYNLWMRDTATGVETALTQDGSADEVYDHGPDSGATTSAVSDLLLEVPQSPNVYFSPDSRRLLAYRIDARAVEKLALIQTVQGGRPRLHTYRYPIAGDQGVAQAQMALFDLEQHRQLPVLHPQLLHLTDNDMLVSWNEAGTQVGFAEFERGYRAARFLVADAQTGEVRTAVEERSEKYINRGIQVRLLGEQREVIWSSERDGWNHLYRIDGRTGTVLNQITRGEWAIHRLLHVDDGRGYLYFTAGGKDPGADPYYRHVYRVKRDGTALRRLTPEDADHDVVFAPSGRYFVDSYSRIDAAPVAVLRAADGRWIRELQRSDITALVATGWKPAEPFKVKARDGKTDLYGATFRPSHFDPRRAYPVLDAIYPGPQHIQTPKSFAIDSWDNHQALAELGFIVVTLDGMGTPLRSRAFREASYDNMGNAGGLDDHVAGIKQLAARYPYMDLTRVGIYGNSGGGYASVRALLKFPEFYKVAVATAGNHDQRSYWAEWGERFHGFPVGANYLDQASAPLVANLQGKLLLVHGDMDDNVHPALTMQLVDGLIAANKNFDLLIMPNRNHGLIDLGKGKQASQRVDPYFLRKRWDYFVENLLGVAPPKEFLLRLDEG